ncbi:hybrid sensor histidine kinase/response regulator [Caminibacter mediatlanticus TB-2]|uniref:histidine kinase n=1 Tax=Caminibacter mediatlanticus TB-2 TaxID=391592 RepID=A0AAI9AIF3_9BACT|nr:response regulator [Caminibacter mediatlanticus]EDM24089.1 chemotaxis protein CheA [Caminibacter mediatlanticus TB-2]QCT94451.1 hybrid sensor histidine kinase/response regulator [Caminibacter mediatlanticus TB-2]
MDELMELLDDFLVESFEMIEEMDNDLIELENNPDDLELLNKIFRVAHTIKGSGSFLNFNKLTKLTHHMEAVLDKARKGELKITPEIMDVILESIDAMKAILEYIRDNKNDESPDVDIEPIVKKLDSIVNGTFGKDENTEEEKKGINVEEITLENVDELDLESLPPEELDAILEKLVDEVNQPKEEKETKEEIQEDTKSKKDEQENQEKKEESKNEIEIKEEKPIKQESKKEITKKDIKKQIANVKEQTIRVDVKRLDQLMNLIGELVLAKNRLIKIYNDVEERYEGEKFLEELNQVVSSISIVTTDLQIAVMKTRMLPIGKVFNKFPRLVRDLARELGKKVKLIIEGEDTELDKSIIEEIGDPLVHMIRNAVDHGIEPPEERKKKGKPEEGTIWLRAYNEGNMIVIEIKDDGKGMDPEKLKKKAIEKGIITPQEAENMSDKEAFMLIFKPGFSTAEKVTNVSGRGVGMDVVKTNIEKLNGIIEVDSVPGKGSTFKLKIPLTLAIIQALLVASQEDLFAVPLSNVIETVRIVEEDIYTIEGKSVLKLRDEVLPLVNMADIFEIEKILEPEKYLYVVILGLGATKIGLIVDRFIGQEEIVIKSLGEFLKGLPGIAGATIRGDGRVTLIVDVASLMKLAKETHNKKLVTDSLNEAKKKKEKPQDYKVLIVDDSAMDRKIMRQAIEPLEVTILEAKDGVEALNILKQNNDIDAMLIDIEMPRMDGYTLAQEIRKYNKFRKLPLIAVTSRATKSDRVRGVEVGMNEYITKPYTQEYLQNVVRRNLKL